MDRELRSTRDAGSNPISVPTKSFNLYARGSPLPVGGWKEQELLSECFLVPPIRSNTAPQRPPVLLQAVGSCHLSPPQRRRAIVTVILISSMQTWRQREAQQLPAAT